MGFQGSGGAVSGFGAQQNTGGGFGAPAGRGLFGSGAGQGFGQSSFQSGAASSGFFGAGNSSQGFGGASSGFGSQQQAPSTFGQNFGNQAANQLNNANQQGKPRFFATAAQQQLFSTETRYAPTTLQQDDGKGGKQSLRFHNVRFDEKLSLASQQMIRLNDLLARQKGQPQPNPEWTAAQQWQQRKQQYPLLACLAAEGPQPGTFGGTGQTSTWGQPQGAGAPSAGFGAQQPQSSGFGGLFGQNQPQQQNQQPQNNLFGGQQNTGQQSTNPFGQTSAGLSSGFGGTGAFGGQQSSGFGASGAGAFG